MTSPDEEMPDADSQSTDGSRIQSSSQPGSPLAAEVPTTEVEISETISIVADEKASGKMKVRKLRPKKGTPDPEVVNPRGYQREMLEHSLKRNVIVAMDTGSGKTQVAVLRIQAELERCSPDKMIWFLGKTVSLCEQQFDVLERQMPSVSMKLLTGQSNIDAWSEDVWPVILEGTRVVVSTFEILRDALDHAFVRMDMLALIVFDEVHNCVKNSSGRKIMVNFYHEKKIAGKPVPAILGLTASPVQSKSRRDEIRELEITMNARCVTPTVNRKELLEHVNKPDLIRVLYHVEERSSLTPSMQVLQSEYLRMNLAQDPHIAKLQDRIVKTGSGHAELQRVIAKHDTFSQNQVKKLWSKSKDILDELGPWAADQYISELVSLFLERVDAPTTYTDNWSNEDRTYLAGHLRRIASDPDKLGLPCTGNLTDKANKLIHELLAVNKDTVGIIFVKSRAAVNVLCAILKNHPQIQQRYRVGSVVGSAAYETRKKNVYEHPTGDSNEILAAFRSGAINLLVSTSVLEEGIDVAACNLVICFDETTTLKSYIQRRGRARKKQSKMIILERSTSDIREWDSLEEEMKKRYEHDREELDRLNAQASAEWTSSESFRVPNSDARLDLENARQHLEHFCDKVFRRAYVDVRPVYVFQKEISENGVPTFSATVTLPSALPYDLRKFQGKGGWVSEKNAMKDAAFRAYYGLYRAGLVSDNLLPINEGATKEEDKGKLPNTELLFNPWIRVSQNWSSDADKWLYTYEFIDHENVAPLCFQIALPIELPRPRDITVYPREEGTWTIKCISIRSISNDESLALPDHTSTLLAMHFGHRWKVEDSDHVIKVIYGIKDLSRDQIGSIPFGESPYYLDDVSEKRILVRDSTNAPFIYIKTIEKKPRYEEVRHPFYEYENAPEGEYLDVLQWTRRADFLHAVRGDQATSSCSKPYRWVLPISQATVDVVSPRVVEFGMLIPSIIHELEIQLIALELSSTLLARVGITDLQLVVQAISAPSAIEPVDYERLEFLGDSILKFCTVIQAYSEHPNWPEELLNNFKDRLVSNTRLERSCLESGLSKFILAKSFTGVKWRPLYRENFLEMQPVDGASRFIGNKTLADVVEALVGASFEDGGMIKALKCIKVFLGANCNWHEEGMARDTLFGIAPSDVELPPTMEPLEDLIGYSFQKKSLLIEAMTHGSYAADAHQRSYEQLEFLGDAVLDYLVVSRMFQFNSPIPNSILHLIKTAMVNAHFLAFTNMDNGLHRTNVEVEDGKPVFTDVKLPIWKFMRHSSPEMGRVMRETEKRFDSLRDEIDIAKRESDHYPWALFARLHPEKFYSDLVEAVLGAIWVDSGSMETCAAFLAKVGIFTYLDRILKENIHVKHPKEEFCAMAGNKKPAFLLSEGDGPMITWGCSATVEGRVVGISTGALNKFEAETKAAEAGIKVLKREKELVKEQKGAKKQKLSDG
ncbi:Dicer-like protein 2 [Fusarium irregulare]|nr:Dicer-like protein 2 [Fusarium irregulare]